jgi:hypothetical protein
MTASHRALVPMSTALVLSSGPGAVHQRHYYGHSGGIPSGQPLNNSFVVFPRVLCRRARRAVVPGTHPYSRPGVVVSITWTHGARLLADR